MSYSKTFTQLNRDCHRLILGHIVSTKINHSLLLKSNVSLLWYVWAIVPRSGYIKVRDQSMVESGGKNTASFHFRGWTQTGSLNLKSNDFHSYVSLRRNSSWWRKKMEVIRKVLGKSFIQWFWELNLCSYKNRVDCFDSLLLLRSNSWLPFFLIDLVLEVHGVKIIASYD